MHKITVKSIIAALLLVASSLPVSGAEMKSLASTDIRENSATPTEKKPTDEQMAKILSAAKLPSDIPQSSYHLTVVKNPQLFRRFLPSEPAAAVVVIVSAAQGREHSDAFFGAAWAAQSMYVAAKNLGISAHLHVPAAEGSDKPPLDVLGIPRDYKIIVTLVVGSPSENGEPLSEDKKVRSLDHMINTVE